MITSFSLLAQYFDKLYPLATGLVYTCLSLGLMIFAPFTQVLLDAYGWRNTFLVIGGVLFHLVVCGALFRSPKKNIILPNDELQCSYSPVTSTETVEELETYSWKDNYLGTTPIYTERFQQFIEISGLLLFKNFSFVALCIMMGTMNASFSGWVVYFIPHCIVKGIPPVEASFLATVGGFSNLIGHLIYIPFVSRNIISAQGFSIIAGAIAAISLFVDAFTNTFATLLIPTILYAGGIGAAFPLCDVCLKSVVDEDSLPKAFGWRLAFSGLFRIVPGFIVGKLYHH